MSLKEHGHGFTKRTKLICLIVCSVLLVASIVGATFAWFRGVISAPGGEVHTAKISVSSVGYSVSGTSVDPASQTGGFGYQNIYKGKLDGTNAVARRVENKVASLGQTSIVGKDDMYTALYIVKRDLKSVDIDVQFTFTIENPDDDLAGFTYYLANVTDEVDLSGITLPEISGDDTPVNVDSVDGLKDRLDAYLKSDQGQINEEEFNRSPKQLANLGGDFSRGTITAAGEKDYAVIRLSVKRGDTTENLPQYTDKNYIINGELTVAQVGALSGEPAGNVHDVYNLGDLQKALKEYVSGDRIRILSSISVSGDVNFPRPVTVEVISSTFTVRGNLRFTYAYEGTYKLDLTQTGQLVVAQEGGAGGNFYMDTPQCKVDLVGSGSREPSAGDIYLTGDVRANVSFEEGRGLTVSRTTIYNTNTAEIPSSAAAKGILLMDRSRLMLSANSYLASVEEYTFNDPSAGAHDVCSEIAIVNYGEIGRIDLWDMNHFTEEQEAQIDHPQIYIENHSVVGTVRLPIWSVKWIVQEGGHTGNTRIICYLGAELKVVEGSPFQDEHVERMGMDTDPIVPLNAEGEQETQDSLITGFRVNYYVRDEEEASDLSIELRFDQWLNGEDWAQGQRHSVDFSQIDYLEVLCYGLPLDEEDYAYIQGVEKITSANKRSDSLGFPNLVTLDLSEANSVGGTTPDRAFCYLEHLQNLDLPEADTSLGSLTSGRVQLFHVNAPIAELYLPETYTQVNTYLLRNIHYLHILNTSNVVILYDRIYSYYVNILLPSDAMVEQYRTAKGSVGDDYINYPWKFALEGTHYGHYFVNLDEGSMTAQITAVDRFAFPGATNGIGEFTEEAQTKESSGVNGVSFNFDAIAIDGRQFTVTSIYSYAFYRMIKDLPSITFSEADTLEIGYRAFYDLTVGELIFRNPSAQVTLGEQAFYRNDNATGISGEVQFLGTVTMEKEAFRRNTLTKLTVNNADIGESTMRECANLTAVVATGNLTTGLNSFYQDPALVSVAIAGEAHIGRASFYDCNQLVTFTAEGEGEIERAALQSCEKLVSAICPKVTRLGTYALCDNPSLLLVDFPSLVSARYSLTGCKSLQFIRTGIISQHDVDVTGELDDGANYNYVIGNSDPVRLHLITASADNQENISLSDVYTLYWRDANTVAYQMRVPMPDWLYQLYLSTPSGVTSKYTSRLAFAHNTDDAGYEDWRYCRYQGGELVECEPYKLDEVDGVWTLTLPDYVFYSKNGVTKIVACVGATTADWGDAETDTFTVPGTIKGNDGDLTVTVVGDNSFTLTAVTQKNLVFPESIEKIEDRAFYIMRDPGASRGEIRYDFEKVEMTGVTEIGSEAFYVYKHSAMLDFGFKELIAPSVRKIGFRAFRYNDLYTLYMPEVVEIGYEAFYENSNLYSAYIPKFERENNTDVTLSGNQFGLCNNLRFAFVGPLARINGNFIPDYTAIFINASQAATTTEAFNVPGNGIQRYFLYYPTEATDYDRYVGLTTPDYTSMLVGANPFEEDYLFGNQEGKKIEFTDLFKYETWAGESVTDDTRPSYIYRHSGEELVLVSAHGKHTGEYEVPDRVGDETVDVIGWTYNTTREETPDTQKHYFDSAFSSCDLSTVTHLTFGDEISRIALHGIGWWATTNTYCLGRVSVNTNGDSCIVDISNVEHIGDYAFHATNVTKLMSEDTVMDFGTYCFSDCSKLTEIDFPNATSFGGALLENGNVDETKEFCVFQTCTMLTKVSLPAAETLYGLLRDCDALESIEAPHLKTAHYSFSSCAVLTSVSLGTEATGDMLLRAAFRSCPSLVDDNVTLGNDKLDSLVFSDQCITGITTMTKLEHSVQYVTELADNGLRECGAVEEIYLPRVRKTGVLAIYNNDSLTTVQLGGAEIDDGNHVTVSVGNNLFDNCGALVTLDLPYVRVGSENCFINIPILESIKLTGIKELGESPFSGCPRLATIQLGPEEGEGDADSEFTVPGSVLSGTIVESVTWAYATELATSAFAGSALTSVDLPRVTTVGRQAFYNCNSLKGENVHLGSEKMVLAGKGVHLGPEAFWSCEGLGDIEWPYITSIDQYHCFFDDVMPHIKLENLKEITTYTADRGSSPFNNTYEIETLEMSNLTVWPVTGFHDRTKATLTTVDVSSLVEMPSSAFSGCKVLSTVKADGTETVGGSAFNGCTGLQTIELKSASEIGNSAFSGCTGLTSISLPHAHTVGESAFNGTSNLETLTLGNPDMLDENGNIKPDEGVALAAHVLWDSGLKELNCDYVVSMAQYALRKTRLETVVLNGIKSIDFDLFYLEVEGLGIKHFEAKKLESWANCTLNRHTGLEEIIVPSLKEIPASFCSGLKSLTEADISGAEKVGNNAFFNCSVLSTLKLGEESPIQTVGSSAFSGCSLITTVELPNVQTVSASAFANTTALETLTLGAEGKSENVSIDGATILNGSGLKELDSAFVKSIVASAFNGANLTTLKLNGMETITVSIGDSSFKTLEHVEMTGLTFLSGTTFQYHTGLQTALFPLLEGLPANCFNGCAVLRTVNVESAKDIGSSAFDGCSEITEIALPNVQTIAASAFANTTALQTLTLGDKNRSKEVTLAGTDIFSGSGLQTLDSEYVKSVVAGAFNGAKIVTLKLNGLEGIDSAIFNATFTTLVTVEMTKLTSMTNINFKSHANLQSVNFQLLVSVPADCFNGCTLLDTVNILSATSIGNSAFKNCASLSDLSAMSIEDVGSEAFSGCINLKVTSLFKTDRIETIGSSAFAGCSALESIDLSYVQTIGASAFSGCVLLNSVTLGSARSVHEVGEANRYVELAGANIFYGCTALTTLESDWVSNLSAADIFSGSSIQRLVLNEKLTDVSFANALRWNGTTSDLLYVEMDSVTVMDATNNFPSSKTKLQTLKLPKLTIVPSKFMQNAAALTEVDVSGATVVESDAFSGCTALTTIDISNATNVGASAFSGCGSLSTVKLEAVTDIGANAFLNCARLTNLTGELAKTDEGFNTLASLAALGSSAFSGCTALESVSLPSITAIEASTFLNCSSLTKAEAGQVLTIAGSAFSGCSVLSEAEVPLVRTIEGSAFKNCTNLRTIALDNLETLSGSYNFQASGLTYVNLSKLKTMYQYSFQDCTSLQQVVLGKDFTTMGHYNFLNCTDLRQLIIEARDTTVFTGTNSGMHLFNSNHSDINAEFKVLVHYDIYDAVKTTGNVFQVNFNQYFRPMEAHATGDYFEYYVSEIQTVSDQPYYEVVYIMPREDVELTDSIKANVPDDIEIDPDGAEGEEPAQKYNIISVKPTAWSGLTEQVTEIEFPRRMTVFHTSSMLYMPASVEKFSLPERTPEDTNPNYFQTKDGMLFDSAGWTLLAVPKAYQGKDNGKAVVIGEGATADVNVISARAFYGSSIEKVFVVNKAIYINGEAFAYSALTEIWFTGEEDTQVSYFIGSDIFTGTEATIYVPQKQRTRYTYRDVGSEYLLGHLASWGAGEEHTEVPDYSNWVIEGGTHVEP